MTWTDERTEQLKKLWRNGVSCSQIAAELGGVSRNGVIGKVHRLGLAGRKPKASERARKPKDKPAHPWQQMPAIPAKPTSGVPAQPAEASVPVPVKQRRSLLSLRLGECRWPYGDPQDKANFYFCGAKAVDERPYCREHCALAYRPASAPREYRRKEAA